MARITSSLRHTRHFRTRTDVPSAQVTTSTTHDPSTHKLTSATIGVHDNSDDAKARNYWVQLTRAEAVAFAKSVLSQVEREELS